MLRGFCYQQWIYYNTLPLEKKFYIKKDKIKHETIML